MFVATLEVELLLLRAARGYHAHVCQASCQQVMAIDLVRSETLVSTSVQAGHLLMRFQLCTRGMAMFIHQCDTAI
jgi:hypothetical protein